MNFLKDKLGSAFVWVKLWPLATQIFMMVYDGKITRQEVKEAVDTVFQGKDVIVLWKPKNAQL